MTEQPSDNSGRYCAPCADGRAAVSAARDALLRGDISASLSSLSDLGSALSAKARLVTDQAAGQARRLIRRI